MCYNRISPGPLVSTSRHHTSPPYDGILLQNERRKREERKRVFSYMSMLFLNPYLFFHCLSDVLMPGSTREVSKQFFRCVLIKLAPNGIFSELFRSTLKGKWTSIKKWTALAKAKRKLLHIRIDYFMPYFLEARDSPCTFTEVCQICPASQVIWCTPVSINVAKCPLARWLNFNIAWDEEDRQ